MPIHLQEQVFEMLSFAANLVGWRRPGPSLKPEKKAAECKSALGQGCAIRF